MYLTDIYSYPVYFVFNLLSFINVFCIRLTQEISKNNELVNNINNYQVKISSLEQELTKIKSAPKPVDESPTLRKQVADYSREREDFKGR